MVGIDNAEKVRALWLEEWILKDFIKAAFPVYWRHALFYLLLMRTPNQKKASWQTQVKGYAAMTHLTSDSSFMFYVSESGPPPFSLLTFTVMAWTMTGPA